MMKILLFIILGYSLLQAQNAIVVNEFMSSNVLTIADDSEEYDDWIELYNPTENDIDIAGYYISDDAGLPEKWQIPQGYPENTMIRAGDYLLLWADDQALEGTLHLPFKLGRSEQILISDQNGSIVDSISYPDQETGISYGRYPDGSGHWGYSEEPSPGGANSDIYREVLPAPQISLDSGEYEQAFTVSITGASLGDSIYYALDGSDPDTGFPQYAGPITIDRNTVLKARILNADARSKTRVAVYFLNSSNTLPILSIATDPYHLFDASSGIYANPLESGRAWERGVLLSYFRQNSLQFSENAGLRIQGNTGREMDKKSLRLYFRDGYGPPELTYDFFHHPTTTTFESLVLKSGYDDDLFQPEGTLLRDPLITELWRRTGNVTSLGDFSVLYLNTDFWGIYHIREDINEYFIRDHLGYQDVDMIRLRWKYWELDYGSPVEWQEFLDFVDHHDFSSDSLFNEAINRIDIENYTTVQAFYHLAQYYSWVYGAYLYREKKDDAPWKITIWDADRAYSDVTWNGFTYYTNATEQFWINIISKRFLKNEQYRRYFCNRICDYINTLFLPEKVNGIIDSLKILIEPEIGRETGRWAGTLQGWQDHVDGLKQFVEDRPDIVLNQMADYFQYAPPVEITIQADEGQSAVLVNGITPDQYPWSGTYFREVPVTLTAQPGNGFRFKEWSDARLPHQQTVQIYPSEGYTVSAVFEHEKDGLIRMISPDRTATGRVFPLITRVMDYNGSADPHFTGTVSIVSSPGDEDIFTVKKGAGTFVTTVTESSDFTISLTHEDLDGYSKKISLVNDYPSETYAGTLPQGDITWDSTMDRVITADLTIPDGCDLTITEGTQVLLGGMVNIFVQGTLTITGSEARPVLFLPNTDNPWGGIEFYNTPADFRYGFFVMGGGDVSKPWQHASVQPVLLAKNDTDLNLNNCFILNSPGKAIGSDHSRVTVEECITAFVFHGGEYHYTVLNYRDSYIMNIPNDDHIFEDKDSDGFHIDYLYPGYDDYSVIENCIFITGKDDAVDQHAARVLVKNCYIEDWMHEGVASSGGDTIKVFNVVVRNCEQGIEAGWTDDGKTHGPHVLVDHCVVLDNDAGLRFGDSYSWTYLGDMTVTNTILYNNDDNIRNYLNSIQAPKEGAITISYSMANDEDYNDSPFCITGIPAFDQDYFLVPGSPGSGAGQYGSNLGLIDSMALSLGSVMITEIMYRNSNELNSHDWIELYNPQAHPQDISGLVIRDNRDDHGFVIPQGTVIGSGELLVVCEDTAAFKDVYPASKKYLGNLEFGFGEEDQIRIFSGIHENVDRVAYSNTDPWPAEADGTGHSLTLMKLQSDNSIPANWKASSYVGGSPGYFNEDDTQRVDPGKRVPEKMQLYQNYPNPFNSRTVIRYVIPVQSQKLALSGIPSASRGGVEGLKVQSLVTLCIYNYLGQRVVTLVSEQQRPGSYQIQWDAAGFASGVYFYRLSTDAGFTQARKLVLLR